MTSSYRKKKNEGKILKFRMYFSIAFILHSSYHGGSFRCLCRQSSRRMTDWCRSRLNSGCIYSNFPNHSEWTQKMPGKAKPSSTMDGWMGGWNEDERFYIAQNSSETFDCYVKCRKFLLNNRKKIIENCFAKIKKNSGAEETWKGQELYKAQGLWAREITQRSDSTKM